MDFNKILSLAILFGYMQGFTILFLSIYNGRIKVRAYLFLNLLVLILSLNNLQAWITNNHFSFHSYYLDHHFTPWYILITPFFYLFITEYIEAKHKKWIVGFSIAFFIVVSIIKTVILFTYRHADITIVKNELFDFNKYSELVGLVFIIGVVVYIYRLISRDKNRKILESYNNLQWLPTFMKLGFSIIVIWMIALSIRALYDQNSQFVYNTLRVSITLLIYWITYKAMYTKNSITKKSMGSKRRSFSDKQDYNDYKRLEQCFINTDIYANQTLKIDDVCENLAIGKNKITRIIKKYAKTNFSTYVNSYRVEKAKQLLVDTSFSNYSIESIGLESGYNSNSSFYTHFKKITGKTPKEYQDENMRT